MSGCGIVRCVSCHDPGDDLKVYSGRKYIIRYSVVLLGKTIMEITIDRKVETAKGRRAELRDERDKRIQRYILDGNMPAI